MSRKTARRTRHDPEYELIDTGIFDENRYFDVFVEYAKATSRRNPDPHHGLEPRPGARAAAPSADALVSQPLGLGRSTTILPEVTRIDAAAGQRSSSSCTEFHYGKRWLLTEGAPELLFTDNETNIERLYGQKNRTPYVKDAFHRYLIAGRATRRESGADGHEGRRALFRRDSRRGRVGRFACA